MKSFFFYIHKDLGNEPDVWKTGIGMTPYSVVRARQKFIWRQFVLEHLWFGNPEHINFLEHRVKEIFEKQSGNYLHNYGTQTEIFKAPIADLLDAVEFIIEKYELQVELVALKTPYSASSSGKCPLGIPSEANSFDHLTAKVGEKFGLMTPAPAKKYSADTLYAELFE